MQQTYITQDLINEASKAGTPNFGPIGQIVDVRTYRRFIPELQRRETFYERNARVVNHSISLGKKQAPQIEDSIWQREAEVMYSYMNKMLLSTSGRNLWIGGTPSNTDHPASSFNCSFLAINRLNAFAEVFELLMLGTGVGYRVFKRDVAGLPKIDVAPTVAFKTYEPIAKGKRSEETVVAYDGNIAYVTVGDSRESWIAALMFLLQVATGEIFQATHIVYNLDNIRPMGERIYGFGGTASGPEALKTMINDVELILAESPGFFRPIDAMDICCAIAKGVVAGSSRRSALITLFEQGDDQMANAKVGLYTDPEMQKKNYRAQSNNTEMLTEKPSVEWLTERLESVKVSGEPGFDNYNEMVRRRRNAAIKYRVPKNSDLTEAQIEQLVAVYLEVCTNPCHEIIGTLGLNFMSGGFCNLTTLPLPAFVEAIAMTDDTSKYEVNLALLEAAIRITTRIGLRQTCVDIPMEGWDETQADERLLGVSCTGWQDAFDLLDWEVDNPKRVELMEKMRGWANDEADSYSKVLDVPRPLLVTTIKPEGTASQVFGVSSGLHWNWAPYYYRRVRMTARDPLSQTLLEMGYNAYPEIYDLEKLPAFLEEIGSVIPKSAQNLVDKWKTNTAWEKLEVFEALNSVQREKFLMQCNTIAFEFPCKSPAKKAASEVPALEQLESMRQFTVHYTDHMPSSTITVKEDEWEAIPEWIHENWDDFTTCSFLSYYGGGYPLLPFEQISEKQYYAAIARLPVECLNDRGSFYSFNVDEEILARYESLLENPDLLELESMECQKGGCPVR